MAELRERVWGVISERGCERAGVDYAEAARLVRELREARISGLCIVTEQTARQLLPVQADAPAIHSQQQN